MKTFRITLAILVASIFMIASCEKEETKTVEIHKSATDGQATIKGTVTYLDAASGNYIAAPGAVIKIATDTTSKAFNQFWMTDSAGNFQVKGLAVGNYYLASTFTDKNNLTYNKLSARDENASVFSSRVSV